MIRLAPELGVLHHTESVVGFTIDTLPRPGVSAFSAPTEHIPEEVMCERLAGRTAGEGAPYWHDGTGGAPIAGVHVCRAADVLHAPEFGAVISSDGAVFQTTVAEALYLTPSLSGLPGVEMSEGTPMLSPPARPPHLKAASVFVPWGARFNYGHFLLDCLPALAALSEQGLLTSHTPVAPPLNEWQEEALGLFLGAGQRGSVRQLAEPLVRIDDVVFASPMDHFLHAPNTLVREVRSRMLSAIDEPDTGLRRLYLSRQRDGKRRLVNETELEAALVARGFAVIHPQEHSVARQIALARDAEIIVAPTGAALANALFCSPGAKVFEIQPTNFVGIWVRALCHMVGVDWHGYFAPSPLSETEISIEDVPRPGTIFDWRLPLEAFLGFLDAKI